MRTGVPRWGDAGRKLWEAYLRAEEALSAERAKPCSCWYCTFTAEQKQNARDEAAKKQQVLFEKCRDMSEKGQTALAQRYNPADVRLGAWAEAVFAVRFGGEINNETCPFGDYGFDVMLPHFIVVDVKATRNRDRRPIEKRELESARRPHDAELRPYAIKFAFVQVCGEHVFPQGFSNAEDPFVRCPTLWSSECCRPEELRDFQELENMLSTAQEDVF